MGRQTGAACRQPEPGGYTLTAIYLMLPVSLLLALIFLIAYVWSIRSGQYDDTRTPSLRILTDDVDATGVDSISKTKPSTKNP